MRILLRLMLLSVLLISEAQGEVLKLAAWNLSWLTLRPQGAPELPADVVPKRPEDIARLRDYALKLDADVVAFSEVDGPEIAAQVFPPSHYAIHITGDHVVQRVGFAVRRGLGFIAHPDLTALDVHPRARFHLRSAADITLNLPGGALRLLAVHLKSGCSHDRLPQPANPACVTLAEQIAPLQDWITARGREGGAFALMGDFNRWMAPQDRFLAALRQAAPLADPQSGLHSPCWGGGGFLDHILTGNAASDWLAPGSFRVLTYRETGAIWKARLSDHCPISVRLAVPDARRP